MMRRLLALAAVVAISAPVLGVAQDDSVLIPSELELTPEQTKDLQTMIDKEMLTVVKKCVGIYPRPEYFTALTVSFDLRKSGDLRGSYVPAVADSNMYVKSEEELAKLEEAGSLARLVVRNDRDMERCFQKGTREFETELDRYSASISASYSVSWKGATPTLKSTAFEVTKS